MKPLIFILLLLIGFKGSTQSLTRSDVENFGSRMAIKKHFSDFTKAGTYEIMRRALFNIYKREPQPSEMGLAFETFGNKQSVYDNFFYETVISQYANIEMSRMAVYSFCDNMQLSIKIVTYIEKKFQKQIKAYLASLPKVKAGDGNSVGNSSEPEKRGTPILEKSFIYSPEYSKLMVCKENKLTIKPKLLNVDSLNSGLINSYFNRTGDPVKKKYQSINAKILLIVDRAGNIVKMIDIAPTKSFENVENIFDTADLSFIQNLKFSPGKIIDNPVNCEFTLNVEIYFSVYNGIIKKINGGLRSLTIKESKYESKTFFIRNDDEFYAPLLKLIKNKIGPSHIYYFETDEQVDSLEIFTPKKIIALGFVKN